MTIRYHAGWNMPGFLADVVDDFETFEDAKQWTVTEILYQADGAADADNEALAEALTRLAAEVNLWSGPDHTDIIGRYLYFITPCIREHRGDR